MYNIYLLVIINGAGNIRKSTRHKTQRYRDCLHDTITIYSIYNNLCIIGI